MARRRLLEAETAKSCRRTRATEGRVEGTMITIHSSPFFLYAVHFKTLLKKQQPIFPSYIGRVYQNKEVYQ